MQGPAQKRLLFLPANVHSCPSGHTLSPIFFSFRIRPSLLTGCPVLLPSAPAPRVFIFDHWQIDRRWNFLLPNGKYAPLCRCLPNVPLSPHPKERPMEARPDEHTLPRDHHPSDVVGEAHRRCPITCRAQNSAVSVEQLSTPLCPTRSGAGWVQHVCSFHAFLPYDGASRVCMSRKRERALGRFLSDLGRGMNMGGGQGGLEKKPLIRRRRAAVRHASPSADRHSSLVLWHHVVSDRWTLSPLRGR